MAMDIHGCDGENFPLFPIDRTRDALAAYCQARWPVGRRRSIAREWDLSAEEARSVSEGSPSQTTLDKIWRHRRGGWAVLLPVMGALIGPVSEFFRDQIKRAAQEAERAAEHEQLASAAYRRLAGAADPRGPDRDAAAPGREARRAAGTMGAQAARRVD